MADRNCPEDTAGTPLACKLCMPKEALHHFLLPDANARQAAGSKRCSV